MRLVFFSGGLASFAVAHHLKVTYPNETPLLYFNDTLWEDEDLYRFIYEVSDKLELPMMIHSMGIDPVQLMIQQKIIFNSRMGNCSTYLKMKTSADYIKRGKVPAIEKKYNWHLFQEGEYDELYFGIGYEEFHRVGAIKKNWQPFNVKFPLVETMYDYDELLKKYDIKKPDMYLKGFRHNNCKGRCVKAGKGHFKLLYNEDIEMFNQLNHIEQKLGEYVAIWHYHKHDENNMPILEQNEREMEKWHASNYEYQPKLQLEVPKEVVRPSILKNHYLEDIRKEMSTFFRIDLFGDDEIGGCDCFIDYDGVL